MVLPAEKLTLRQLNVISGWNLSCRKLNDLSKRNNLFPAIECNFMEGIGRLVFLKKKNLFPAAERNSRKGIGLAGSRVVFLKEKLSHRSTLEVESC